MKIGLEVHIQLATKSKLFCPCPARGEENENVCPTCLGFPGSRPQLNLAAVRQGVLIAKIVRADIVSPTQFSRKSYFYPDLPKGFQITQFEAPLARGGEMLVENRLVKLTRLQLEEDPARIVYEGENVLIDHSRCGTPLVELVTEPEFFTPEQAREALEWLEAALGMEGGAAVMRGWRCDANISVADERVEIKNVSGAKTVERALAVEAGRQDEVVRSGGRVGRETRLWDDKRGVTVSSREKETEADYGYILEPDIPPVDLIALFGEKPVDDADLDRFRKIGVGPSAGFDVRAAVAARPSSRGAALTAEQSREVEEAMRALASEDRKALEDARANPKAMNALVGMVMKRSASKPPAAAVAEKVKGMLGL